MLASPDLRRALVAGARVVVESERGPLRGVLERIETHWLRATWAPPDASGRRPTVAYALALVAVEGEAEPRWFAVERVRAVG